MLLFLQVICFEIGVGPTPYNLVEKRRIEYLQPYYLWADCIISILIEKVIRFKH
jgi:hypothetical protein